MRGLEEIYLKGFSYDKYLGIASKEELEKLDELYKNIVDTVKKDEKTKYYITEGDIFQAVVSNRREAKFKGSLLNAYRVLRTMNPSPYMFYMSGNSLYFSGASPETLVKLQGRSVYTFPIAGTLPRGKNEEEDRAQEAKLSKDEKELAEHNMLVDLGRNDIGKVCEFGSVQVEALHQLQRLR